MFTTAKNGWNSAIVFLFSVWLDGTDEKVEGQWIWYTTGQNINYFNWSPNKINVVCFVKYKDVLDTTKITVETQMYSKTKPKSEDRLCTLEWKTNIEFQTLVNGMTLIYRVCWCK
jgi:hypothetical protein